MTKELLEQLFPNLEEVLALHNQYNQKMKERAKAGFPVGNIGDMLCEMVRLLLSLVKMHLTLISDSVRRSHGRLPCASWSRIHQEPKVVH